MKIMVMRHSAALTRAEAKVAYDAQRPLSDDGRAQAIRLGKSLQALGCVPNPVVTSPFVRTQETASLMCRQFAEAITPFPLIILAPGSSRDELLRAAVNYGNTALNWMLAVMHEPDVSYILSSLLMAGKTYPIPIQEGDLFALDISIRRGNSTAELLFYLSPQGTPGPDLLTV
jgi:phosphohistidine phosphatase SixA